MMKLRWLYVLICFILDVIIADLLPFDYAASSFVFIPALGFSSMLLITKKMELRESLIFVVCVGFLYGLFIPGKLILYPLLFASTILLTRIWLRSLNETMVELGILCIVAITIKDLLLYFYMMASGTTGLSLFGWAKIYLFTTVLGNILILPIALLLYYYFGKLALDIENRQRQQERIPWNR